MSKFRLSLNGPASTINELVEIGETVGVDRNNEEAAMIDEAVAFVDSLMKNVFAKETDGKFSIDVTGEALHDGATLSVEFTLRKVVLPHNNALEGSAAAFPPTAAGKARQDQRRTDTRVPGEVTGAPVGLTGKSGPLDKGRTP